MYQTADTILQKGYHNLWDKTKCVTAGWRVIMNNRGVYGYGEDGRGGLKIVDAYRYLWYAADGWVG